MLGNIEAERARMSMSKSDLAEKVGVDRSTLRRWVLEESEIPASKLLKMADMFGCSIDYLLGRTAPPEKRA